MHCCSDDCCVSDLQEWSILGIPEPFCHHLPGTAVWVSDVTIN